MKEKIKTDFVPEKTKAMPHKIDVAALSKILIWIDGYKSAKGNLLPLGTNDLDEAWNAVSYLNGDVRFTAPRDTKY